MQGPSLLHSIIYLIIQHCLPVVTRHSQLYPLALDNSLFLADKKILLTHLRDNPRG